jgi:hypothetical protein
VFAPLGFVPIENLFRLCQEAAVEWMAEFDDDDVHYAELKLMAAGEEIFTVWILDACFKSLPVYIGSTDGTVLRAAPMLLRHEDQPSESLWIWPPVPGSKLEMAMQEHIKDPSAYKFSVRFRFVNVFNSSIQGSAGWLDKMRASSPMDDDDVEQQCVIAAKLNGWCVCIAEDDYPSDVASLWEAVATDPDQEGGAVVEATSARGRPRLQGATRRSFLRLFPQGRGEASWREVEHVVSKDLGYTVSARTIQRSVGQNSDRNDKGADKTH